MPHYQIPRVRKITNAGLSVGSFDELAGATMTPASRIRAKRRADVLLARMTLDELRKNRKVTQGKVAAAMQINQSEVSRIEKRKEVKLGTLRDYVSALGGYLEIRAVFPEKKIELAIAGK